MSGEDMNEQPVSVLTGIAILRYNATNLSSCILRRSLQFGVRLTF